MKNNRLEYNPLFESLTDTARRYERISEEDEQTTEYKKKYAAEYATRILAMIYEQYSYFVSSMPVEEKTRSEWKNNLQNFIKENSTKSDLSFKEIADSMISEMDKVNSSLKSNEIFSKKLKAYPSLENIQNNISGGIKELKNTIDLYSQKYGDMTKDPSVIGKVKEFITNTITALEKIK